MRYDTASGIPPHLSLEVIHVTGKHHRLDMDDLVRRYLAGESCEQIARSCGVAKGGTIAARLRRLGIEIRVSNIYGRLPLDEARILRLYAAGQSEKAIADRLGITRSPIRRILLAAGIQPRGRSEAELLKWSQMSGRKRTRQTRAAHEAARGSTRTFEQRCRSALGKQAAGLISIYERHLGILLRDRGIEFVPQQAIGPYNCDLGAHPVAVEIFGGNWHWSGRHMERTPERFRYIMNAGWSILVLWVNTEYPLTPEAADYMATFIQAARRNPTARREYRVVRGAGELVACGSIDDDEISIEPAFTNSRDPATGRYKRVPRNTMRV